jgi:hypothetical protein
MLKKNETQVRRSYEDNIRAESCDPISSHGPEPRITFRVKYKARACILKLMFALNALHSLASAVHAFEA